MASRPRPTSTRRAPARTPQRDRRIAEALEEWFPSAARDLPWRHPRPDGARDPYRALVSEAMLQQTQASRVAERFHDFLAHFPDVHALARASEEDVLAAWSGLGYYRRARLLHRAARAIVERHAGRIPADAAALRALPGVGPYTAGSIASIVFGAPEPIVDANVRRVVSRLDGEEHTDARAWDRARALVGTARSPAIFNEAMMELGALVCTPRAPRCASCPLARSCRARREGRAERIPAPRRGPERRPVHHASVVVRDGRGRLLVERRPDRGLWAGMWQAPTLEHEAASPAKRDLLAGIGLTDAALRETFTHLTTHRRVEFAVWEGRLAPRARPARGSWATVSRVRAMALSSPQRRILLGER